MKPAFKLLHLLEGHFVCVSGLHTDRWIHKDSWFSDPRRVDRLCGALARRVRELGVEVVCGPATGGLLVAHAVARHLGCQAVFTESFSGRQVLRRGYGALVRGRRVLLVDDIINTGCTLRSSLEALAEAEVVGTAVLVQRNPVDWPGLIALSDLSLPAWTAAECPLCRAGVPVDSGYGHG